MKWMKTIMWTISLLLLTPLAGISQRYPGVQNNNGILQFDSEGTLQSTLENLRADSKDYFTLRRTSEEIPCEVDDPILEDFETYMGLQSLRKQQLLSECQQLEAGIPPEAIQRHWLFEDFLGAILNTNAQVQIGPDILYLYSEQLTYLVKGGSRQTLRQLERGANPYAFPDVEVTRNYESCSAEFSANANSTTNTVNLTYQGNPPFGAITFLWEFGDGATSTLQNPSHTYAAASQYEICLTIEVEGEEPCADRVCKTIAIGDATCLAAFFYNETGAPGQICFQDLSTFLEDVESYQWTFGDGTSSSEQNPCHTYGCDKTYFVNLKITTVSGCISNLTLPVFVNSNQCCGKKAEYDNLLEFNGGQNKIVHLQGQINVPFIRWVVAKVVHYKKKSNGKWKREKADLQIELDGNVFLPGTAGCKCEMPFSIDFIGSLDNKKSLTVIRVIGSPFKARIGEEWSASFFVNGNLLQVQQSVVYCD